MSDVEGITLEDIELMLTILERFIKVSRRAERVVRYLAPSRSSGQQDFVKELIMGTLRQKGYEAPTLAEEFEEEPLDDETKALIEKIRAKKQQAQGIAQQ
jgi:hypothetical protein